LKRDGNDLYTAEGDYGNKVRIQSPGYRIVNGELYQVYKAGNPSKVPFGNGWHYVDLYEEEKDTESPTITDVRIENLTDTGFDVSCIVHDNKGVSKVQMCVTNTNNDFCVWYDAIISNGRWKSHINISEHNSQAGKYSILILAWDDTLNSKSETVTTFIEKDEIPPSTSDIRVENVTHDGYDISCVATDNKEVAMVRFATWTEENGRDDERWEEGVFTNGRWKYHVNVSDHGNQFGKYVTHIYAYDTSGNYAFGGWREIIVEPEVPKPEITANPKDVTASLGDMVTFEISTNNVTSYQWYYCADNSSNWLVLSSGDITGYDTNKISFKLTDKWVNVRFKCIVQNKIGESETSQEAKAIEKRCLVSLDPVGGTTSLSQLSLRDTYEDLPTPTRDGYIFDGWSASKTGGSIVKNGDKLISKGNHTLYAQWTGMSYRIVFNANGGSGSMSSLACQYDKNYRLPSNTFKAPSGYKFKSWSPYQDGHKLNFPDTACLSVVPPQNGYELILYAQWEEIEYVVHYDANGGTLQANDGLFTKQYSNLPTPVRTGYVFTGWYSSKSDGTKAENGKNLVSKKDHTLYAQWKAIKYNIVFDANGGTGKTNKMTCSYDKSYKLTSNAFKAKEGYAFAGWNTAPDGSGIPFANASSIKNLSYTDNDSVVLYAQWSVLAYIVTFDANGGTSPSDEIVVSARYKDLPTPVRNGYVFNGWYSSKNGGKRALNDKQLISKKNHTLYAHWSPLKYTISFDANGGKGKMGTMKCTYGKAYKLTKNSFKAAGYSFVGWNTKANGSGTFYTNNDSVKNLMSVEGNVVLYAQWVPITYSVTFDSKGGSQVQQQTIYFNPNQNKFERALVPYEPTRDNYTFVGWYSDKSLKKKYNFNTPVTKNITLYAKWKAE
jgi:uncharacterized repeat protein (TIGR02543 family)